MFLDEQKSPLSEPWLIILMGPPGAGKGTHAAPLSRYLGIPHISTGDLFRSNIRAKTPIGLQAKAYIDQGQLVPDDTVLEMLFERLAQSDCQMGAILDGFPRTVPQAEALELAASEKHRLSAINLDLGDEEVVFRISGRLACSGCARPYHKLFDRPQKEGLCDVCESALFQREDDREEIVRQRLQVYHAQTSPLIAYYARKNALTEIDGSQTKIQVFHDLLEAVSLFEPAEKNR